MKAKKGIKLALKRFIGDKGTEYSSVSYNGYPVIMLPKEVAKRGEIFTTSFKAKSGDLVSDVIAIDQTFCDAPKEVRMYALCYETVKIQSKKPQTLTVLIDEANTRLMKETDKETLLKALELIMDYPIDEQTKRIIKKSVEGLRR